MLEAFASLASLALRNAESFADSSRQARIQRGFYRIATLLGEPVMVTDLAQGGDLPPTDGVRLEGETLRVVVRPSGTEPKLKCYLEVRATPEASRDVRAARSAAAAKIDALRTEMSAALGL